ncbi:hypothetical protein ACIA5G_47900 [Amycolatopsis sp. NPDC051758]|uniref:hypothetical protein n=1 Tax=Amycolatopsis sp. NPDC051758 TaxID=3363935 RepID=UPI00378F8C4C
MRRIGMIVSAAAVVPALVAGPTVAAASPASADAYPTLNFLLKDGTGGYYSGTVTFYNRSVGVIGSFNASGCERAYATSLVDLKALDERSTSLHCDVITSGSFSLSADVPGGANRVYLAIKSEYGRVYDFTNCWRDTMICN